jgi:hypothetical protein
LDVDRRHENASGAAVDDQKGRMEDLRSSSGYNPGSSLPGGDSLKLRSSKATEATHVLSLLSGESNTGANGSPDIVIHVCDEGKRVRRDFSCNQDLLLTHMKYFESYLSGVKNGDDVDISVHCDVGVFEWLMEYMKEPSKVGALDAQNVVSILISSNFLQMERLVRECLS